MTEQEYVDVTDRVKISAAIKSLIDIVPENSSVIDATQFNDIMDVLYGWEIRLFHAHNTQD
jgi:hypothetical protein